MSLHIFSSYSNCRPNEHIPTKRVQTETNYSPGADVPSIIFGVLDKQSGWMENDKGKNAKAGELFSSSSFRKKTLKSCWILLVLIKRCIYCNMTQCFKIRKKTYLVHFIKCRPTNFIWLLWAITYFHLFTFLEHCA